VNPCRSRCARAGAAPEETYVQVFRNGAIEAVDARTFNGERTEEKVIPSVYIEKELMEATSRFLRELVLLDFTPPAFLMLTLTGMKGYTMAVDRRYDWGQHPIDRDTLFLPDIRIDDFKAPAATLLKPVFDALWQCMGWHGSLNYDDMLAAPGKGASSGGVNGASEGRSVIRNGRRPKLGPELRMRAPRFDIAR